MHHPPNFPRPHSHPLPYPVPPPPIPVREPLGDGRGEQELDETVKLFKTPTHVWRYIDPEGFAGKSERVTFFFFHWCREHG